MSIVLLGVASVLVILLAVKYFRLKALVEQLVDSLRDRTQFLVETADERGGSDQWKRLIGELNKLIQEITALSRQSRSRLDQIETTLGSLQEGVVIVDRDNYIMLVNRALENLIPSLQNKVGQRIEGSMGSSDFLDFIRSVKTGEGPNRREIELGAGSSVIWFEVTAANLPALEGREAWYLFVLHDITRQKLLEQARKQFVANASHELKTPVSVIKGYAETLVSDHETMSVADRERFVLTIHRHSDRLVMLINDLLSLSRLESESASLDWVAGNVLDWLRRTVAEYRSSSDSGARITLELEDGAVARVEYDPLKLRQVFDNLVENASKYSPKGGEVSIGGRVADGECLLWVQDQGPGVPQEDVRRIFERFYRVDKGRSRESGGTGLGLSIVKHIMELHGGSVRAENREEGGLRVLVSLPLVEDETS